ncbi:unnamed protein product [Schistosoma margrebowiei]|uniref:Uncharacterized protein n=1 Tax=Schistosoma margrebowiei TaxID=48269 RepID=A0A183NA08_9TREM|nr:unnamed protein product [Schistosoma margrebowiei]
METSLTFLSSWKDYQHYPELARLTTVQIDTWRTADRRIPMVDWIMKTSTSEGKHGIQWTAQNQLDDLDFADDLALLSHTHEQMQTKTASVAAVSASLDTASDVTLISKNTWHKLGCPRIRPTEHVARNASGDIVNLTGEVLCNVQLMGSKFTDVCYLTNRHDLDLLGLDCIAHVDTLNKLLDEVCSHNVCYESIQIPNDISKSNASDESSSLDINELNASDETCSCDLSDSNNSNVMCSHHVKSNTADLLPSHNSFKVIQ